MGRKKLLRLHDWNEKKTEIHNKVYKYTKKKWDELHHEYQLHPEDMT